MSEAKGKKKLALPIKIMIGMAIGVAAGLILRDKVAYISFIGDVFMRLLKMCIYPLILLSIISGISQVADVTRLKKVGIAFAIYWVVSSALAAFTGITFATIMKPGVGIDVSGVEAAAAVEQPDILASFVGWVPDNPFASMADGNVIQIIVFAVIFGIILAVSKNTEAGAFVSKMVDSLNEIIGNVVAWVISLAPYGVAVLTADMVGSFGLEVIGGIAKMLVTLYLALAFMLLVIYPIFMKFICHVSPIKFFQNIYPVMLMALSTMSSSATLPVTMKCSKERLGVPGDIVNLVAPPAATINMHGAAVEHPLYVIFAAQLFGVQLTLPEILILVSLGIVMSAGAAGMPGSGIMMATIMLEIMGMPLTMIPWLTGVYFLIDLVSTTMNVTGDTVGMCVVANALGELDRDVFNAHKDAFVTQ